MSYLLQKFSYHLINLLILFMICFYTIDIFNFKCLKLSFSPLWFFAFGVRLTGSFLIQILFSSNTFIFTPFFQMTSYPLNNKMESPIPHTIVVKIK